MKYVLTSNHLLGSICVNPLDYLKLRLNLLPSLLHRKDRPQPHKEGESSPYIEDLVEADVDVPKVRPDCVRPAVFLLLYLWLFQWLCIECEKLPCSTTTGSRKALICK